MNSSERALQGLRALVQFELSTCGAEVAAATAVTARAERQASDSRDQARAALDELKNATERAMQNPVLLNAMREFYRNEVRFQHESQRVLVNARQVERKARSALAELRNQERSLDNALSEERRQERQRTRDLEFRIADDVWLHALWSERVWMR